jgi:predicted nucleotidyltransferase
MEIQIKRAIKAGNSSAVILPRAWLNKEVRVELVKKTPEIILTDVIQIVKKYLDPKEIIGIYLAGSYARGEEDANSDLDLLVVTKKIDREMIIEGIYNILLISSDLIEQKLKKDLFPVGQMIKEAQPLLNSDYLDKLEVKVTKENIKWYLDTSEEKLNLIKEIITRAKEENIKYLNSQIGYTLVLRIRTLHIIKKLIQDDSYSKTEFIKIIKNVSKGKNAYESYLTIKNNLKEKSEISLEEVERLYEYLREQLKYIKKENY